jgi:hypothetical protein
LASFQWHVQVNDGKVHTASVLSMELYRAARLPLGIEAALAINDDVVRPATMPSCKRSPVIRGRSLLSLD